MNSKLIVLGLILLGTVSRLLPHEPNFTAVGAITLFSGTYLPRRHGIAVVFATMLISDLILGFHPTVGWVYLSFALILILGGLMKNSIENLRVFLLLPVSSLLFFAVTNFGVWMSTNMYTHNLKGLMECFTLAIPFFRGTIAGDFVYGVILFGGVEILKNLKVNHLALRIK